MGELYICHYRNVIMGAMASQITSFTIVYSTVCSVTDQRKHQSSASLAFVRDEFATQRASDAEKVSIWWRHHVYFKKKILIYIGTLDSHWTVSSRAINCRCVFWWHYYAMLSVYNARPLCKHSHPLAYIFPMCRTLYLLCSDQQESQSSMEPFQNAHEVWNGRALKFSPLTKILIFQIVGRMPEKSNMMPTRKMWFCKILNYKSSQS